MQGACEHVASVLIGAQQMLGARSHEGLAGVGQDRIVGGEQGSGHRDDQMHHDQADPNDQRHVGLVQVEPAFAFDGSVDDRLRVDLGTHAAASCLVRCRGSRSIAPMSAARFASE